MRKIKSTTTDGSLRGWTREDRAGITRRVPLLAALVAVAAVRSALAEPSAARSEQLPTAPEDAGGVLVPESEPERALAWIPRVLLFPVRLAAEIALAPLRGGAWLDDHYQLHDRAVRLLFSADGTIGVYPTAALESEAGLDLGLRFVDSNVLGHGERVSAAASIRRRFDAAISSGSLFGTTVVNAAGSFRSWSPYNYFGVGGGPGTQTRFAQQVWYGELAVQVPLAGPLWMRALGAYSRRRFDPFADAPGYVRTGDVFDPMTLVGFDHGTNNVYGELAVGVDTTSYANRYIARSSPSSGWLASGFLGATRGLSDDPSRYWRYGFDARRFVDLHGGDRVLVLRAALEAVAGDLDAIPVADLPRLGGSELLRGFHDDRYRDRIAALLTAEYRYPIQEGATAFAFVDAGEVAPAISQLGLRGSHVGGGGGLQFQTLDSFLFRAQVAVSREGTFVQLALDPGTDIRARHRRL